VLTAELSALDKPLASGHGCRPVKKPTAKQLLPVGLAALSGVLYFLGFVGWDQFYLEWFAFAPLVVALDRMDTGRRAFFLSWWMGLVTHLGGYYWVVHLLQAFAFSTLPPSASLPLSVLGYVLLCLFQGSQLAVNGWLAWKLSRRTGIPMGFTLPVALMAVEFAYPLLFPSYTANSQAWVPLLIQVAELGGPLLLSGVIALVGGALGEIALAKLKGRRSRGRFALRRRAPSPSWSSSGWRACRRSTRATPPRPSSRRRSSRPTSGRATSTCGRRRASGASGDDRRGHGLGGRPGTGGLAESALNRTVQLPANLTGYVATEVKAPMIVGAPAQGQTRARARATGTASSP
jgi:hypothetical protein